MKLVLCQPGADILTETFIRNHAENLDANVVVVSGFLADVDAQHTLQPNLSGCWSIAWNWLCGIRPKGDWRSWVMTIAHLEAFRRANADVVLAEYGTYAVMIKEACRINSVPLVVHFHGFDAHHKETIAQLKTQYQELFDQAAAIVCVSYPMREQLLNLGAPADKLHVIVYGVDTDRFQGARPEEAEPVCLSVGRLVPKKAPHLTLLAFHKVAQQYPTAKLRFVGDGPLKDVCHDLVRELKIEHCVEFLGSQSHEDVLQQMLKSRMVVQHSVTASDGDSEGTPNSLLEASSCGLPVVATRHAGIPDAILDNKSGYLVEERDVDAMAKCILDLLNNAQLGAEMGRAGRQHIIDHFQLQNQIRKLNDVLRQALVS